MDNGEFSFASNDAAFGKLTSTNRPNAVIVNFVGTPQPPL